VTPLVQGPFRRFSGLAPLIRVANFRRLLSDFVLLRKLGFGLDRELRGRDSNPDYLIQSQASYH
jgi:hypothetical protein